MPKLSFPIESVTRSGVRVVTVQRSPAAFETAAVFRGKLLNLLHAENALRAGRLHRLLAEAWGSASEGNLLDEASDAPPFVEAD